MPKSNIEKSDILLESPLEFRHCYMTRSVLGGERMSEQLGSTACEAARSGNQRRRMLSIAIGLGAVALGAVGLSSVRGNSDTDSQYVEKQRSYSKDEFSNRVMGMTPQQLRDTFGSPDAVWSGGEWIYDELPVYDAVAGIRVSFVKIGFGSGSLNGVKCHGGGDECVVTVDF